MNLQNKQDYINLLKKIIEPVLPFYEKGQTRLELGATSAIYEQDTIGIEGFSRILWGLVPFWSSQEPVTDPVLKEFEEIYLQGIIHGTDPKSKYYWGKCHDYDQRFVEMAPIAFAMIFAPDKIWKPLTLEEKDNLCNYLDQVNHHKLPDCNWILYNILVNVALKKVGRPYDHKKMDEYLNRIEDFYLGEGWYRDGDSYHKDYYVSWVIHLYCLIYAKAMYEDNPGRSAMYRDRAAMFASQYVYWFDNNGCGLAYGRSLTYRFAQVAFFCGCVINNVLPFSLAQMKGIIGRNIRDFLNYPIFDKAGLLTIGYKYPNQYMAEGYNSPSSPYWCLKAFFILMLPKEHEFWKVDEAPLPRMDKLKLLKPADMLIQHMKNQTVALCGGMYSIDNSHTHAASKYGKFAYSSKYGFSIPITSAILPENAPDSSLVFLKDGLVWNKRVSYECRVSEEEIYIRWSPAPWINVETTLIPMPDGHIRKHKIYSNWFCEAYDCGFALPIKERRKDGKIECLHGSGKPHEIWTHPNTSLIYPRTVIPSMCYRILKGENELETRFYYH